MNFNGKNPWFSLVTPEGPAGVAVWMVGGPGAEECVQGLFRPNQNPLGGCLPNQSLGVLKWGGIVSDEVLLVGPPVKGGASGGGVLEIHAHGGAQLAALHRDFFGSAGLEERSSGELGVFPGSTRLEAHLQQLATQATTARSCRALLHQSRVLPGAFADLIQACGQQDGAGSLAALAKMESGRELARRWLNPFRVSVLGPPNVGKSSLLNFLAGKNRAVVSPVPGTTVDVVRVSLALDGWPVELCDTAGVRDTADEVERQGIHLAFHSADNSDLVLWLRDATVPNPQGPPDLPCRQVLEVWTKRDLIEPQASSLQGNRLIEISTLTGEGCQKLQDAVLASLVGDNQGGDLAPTICSDTLAKTATEVLDMLNQGAFQVAAKRLSWWLEKVQDAN